MSELERRAIAALVNQAEQLDVPVPAELSGFLCGHVPDTGARTFVELNPDAEPIYCCVGEAERGVDGCTCWVAVYDDDQAEPVVASYDDARPRASRCSDCAFRPGSPELTDPYMREALLALPGKGEPFWCHDGMRRPTWWEHPTRGRVPGSPDDWQPPRRNGIPYRADGSQALLCAGWAAIAAKPGAR